MKKVMLCLLVLFFGVFAYSQGNYYPNELGSQAVYETGKRQSKS